MSWLLEDIGSHIEIIKTWNPSESNLDEEFFYIDLSSVDKDKKTIDLALVQKVLGSNAPSRARQLVKTSDVLVSTVRPNLNGVARVPDKLNDATASTGYCVLRANKQTLNSNYLFYWVRSDYFVNDMISKATGANYPAVSDKTIKQSRIPLPPLPEQQKIASILDAADNLRQKDQQLIEKYTALSQSLFLEMFGDTWMNSKSWQETPLSQLVKPDKIITYGIVQAGPNIENGIPYIRTGDIQQGKINTLDLLKTSNEIAKSYERSKCSSGDIVMSIRATVGTIAFLPSELDGANLTQGTARISPNQLVVNPLYLFHCIKSKGIQLKIDSYTKGATFREITLGKLRNINIPLPPMTLQNQFAERIQVIEAQKQLALASLEKSEALFNSLLQRAFKGELTT